MLKFYFYLLLLLVACSCRDAGPVRGRELTRELDSVFLGSGEIRLRVDSLVELSAGLATAERYAVLCHVVCHYLLRGDEAAAGRYLRLVDSLPFPEVEDKATGFLILEQYENAYPLCDHAPQLIRPDKLAALFFNMENRWRLTEEEKFRLLVIKSNVYFNIFREYKSAAAIATQAAGLVTRFCRDSSCLKRMYKVLYQSCIRSRVPEENIALNHKLLTEMELDSSSRSTINRLLAPLYLRQRNYGAAYRCLQEAGCMKCRIYNSIVPQVYLCMDSVPAALAYIGRHNRSEVHEMVQGVMLWDEARARLQGGDTAGYERCVAASVAAFDRFPTARKEVLACLPSVSYVEILQRQGRRKDAVERMKQVCRKLQSWPMDFRKVPVISFEEVRMNLYHQRLMIDGLQEAGCAEEAWGFKVQYDSLQNQFAGAQYRAGQQQAAADMYTADLQRNLQKQADDLFVERYHFWLIVGLLVLVLLGIGSTVILYRKRMEYIDRQYALCKNVEWNRENDEKLDINPSHLTSDEALFVELQEQLYKKQLFLNPGFGREDLCRLGGSNQSYVSASINKYAGMNINQWINRARIDYAIKMIHRGEVDLEVLAKSSGFSSMRSFFRSFKQHMLITPRQYIVREKRR